MGTDIWPAVHGERKALAADLRALGRRRLGHALAVRGLDGTRRARPHDLGRHADAARVLRRA